MAFRTALLALLALMLAEPAHAVVVGCDRRSGFDWPASGRHDVVAGPLTLVGARTTPQSTLDEFGGDKLPALVRPGHRVKVALRRADRRHVSLAFGRLPEGELHVDDGY